MNLQRNQIGPFMATALGLAMAACGGGEAKQPESTEEIRASRRVNVEVEEVTAVPFTDVISIVGVVMANRDVTVAAEESGVIRSIYRDKGARVRAGEPIAKIDDALLQAQLRQAVADAALAREAYERRRRLWEEEKIGTELDFLEARFAAERAAANQQLLEERLERTTIRAPISGILDARMVEVGTMVAPGTPIARIVDVAQLKVHGGVPERFAPEIAQGARARLSFDGVEAAEGEREGRIAFVGTVINDQDRTFPVEVVLTNPGRIKPGMVATVGIDRRTFDSAVAVPQEAVVRTEDGYIVYVAAARDGEIVAEARPVVMGPSQRGRIVIESGLVPGEEIVVVGQQQVVPGDRLEIVKRRGGEGS